MATTYYLTTTADGLGGGSNFSNVLSQTAPSTTLAISVATATTETDRGYTPSDNPGTSGGTGAQNYTVTVDISTGNADLFTSVQLHRINSAGTVQNSSSASGEQNSVAGDQTHSFTSVDLGTFASGDRLRVDFIQRDSTAHGDEALTYGLSSTGTRVEAPWTLVTINSGDIAATGAASINTLTGASTAAAVISSTGESVNTFEGTTAPSVSEADISSAGEALATLAGESDSAGNISATAESVATLISSSTAGGAISAVGESIATIQGASIAEAPITSIAEATATMVGVEVSAGVEAGAMSSAGEAVVSLDGASTASFEITINAEALATLVGEEVAAGVEAGALSSDSAAAMTMGGESTSAGDITATGAALLTMLGVAEGAQEAYRPAWIHGTSRAKLKNPWGRKKRKQFEKLCKELDDDMELFELARIAVLAIHNRRAAAGVRFPSSSRISAVSPEVCHA